jgi:2-hydroxymuconate-semialdehyde hydrolase
MQESFSQMFPEPRQKKLDEIVFFEEEVKKIQHHTLLVHGREDIVIPYKETSLRLFELMPNAELHIFPNCGHWTQIEKTTEFTQLCENFFLRK